MRTVSLITLLQTTESIGSLLSKAVNVQEPRPPAVYDSVLPRGYKLPAIAVHRYNMTRDQDYSGPIDLREDFFQLDVYAGAGDECQAIVEAAEKFLTGFTGALDDGTTVTGAYLERSQDLPFLPNASVDSTAFRSLLGYRFISKV